MERKWLFAIAPEGEWRAEEERAFQGWARDVGQLGTEMEWFARRSHTDYTGSDAQPPFCAFLTLRGEEDAEPWIAAPPSGMTAARFLVSEDMIFDRAPGVPPGKQTPGVKKTTLWRARPDLSAASWQARYREHAKLVPRAHASAWRYRQNLIESAPEGFPYDAISELWWERERDLAEHFYASEDAKRLVAEDTTFIDISSATQVVTYHERL